MTEINKDFYCSAVPGWNSYLHSCIQKERLGIPRSHAWCGDDCRNRHRKHPTPEQFKEEYGFEYPDDGAVYLFEPDGLGGEPLWTVTLWGDIQEECGREIGREIIVCACTPFGAPDKNWRPK